VLNSVPSEQGRRRLGAELDIARTEPEWALAYSWDIVLRGREATPFETGEEGR
jgi:protocatechuate 3,4-dioxygenase, beta subunit